MKLEQQHCNNKPLLICVLILITMNLISVSTIKYMYYIIPSILIIIAILYFFLKKNKLPLAKPVKQYILVLLAFFLISLSLAAYHHDRIPSTIKVQCFALLSITIVFLLSQLQLKFKTLAFCFAIAAYAQGLIAIYDKFYLKLPRAFVERMQIIPAGAIAMALGLITLMFAFHYLHTQQFKISLFLGGGSIMGIIASILTGTRGAWIGLPFVFILILYYYRTSLRKKLIPIILGACTLVLLSFFVPQTGVNERYQQAVSDIQLYVSNEKKDTSIGLRFEAWKAALYGFAEKPIAGWGVKGKQILKKQLVEEGKVHQRVITHELSHAHNQFFEVMLTGGIIGLILLLSIILIPCAHFMQQLKITKQDEQKVMSMVGIIFIVSIVIFCLSYCMLNIKQFGVFYFMVLSIIYGFLFQNQTIKHKVQE